MGRGCLPWIVQQFVALVAGATKGMTQRVGTESRDRA